MRKTYNKIIFAVPMVFIFFVIVNQVQAQQKNLVNQGHIIIMDQTHVIVNGDYRQIGDMEIGIDDGAGMYLNGNLLNSGSGRLTNGLTGKIHFRGDSIKSPEADIRIANFDLDLDQEEDTTFLRGNLRITDHFNFIHGNFQLSNHSLFLEHEEAIDRLGLLSGELEGKQLFMNNEEGVGLTNDSYIYTAGEIRNPINKGNLGLTVTMSNGSGGVVNVKRYHTFSSSLPNAVAGRVYDVLTTNDPSQGTVEFSYFDNELGELSEVESELLLFQSSDGGNTWQLREAVIDIAENKVTSEMVNSINGLWVLSTCTSTQGTIAALNQACEDQEVTLTSTLDTPGEFMYQWFQDGEELEGETSDEVTLAIGNNTSDILLEITNAFGCTSVLSYQVSPASLPVFDLGDDLVKCKETQIQINAATGFNSYQWFNDQNELISTESFILADAGRYMLEVKNEAGCTYQDEIVVTDFADPEFVFDDEVNACGQSAMLGLELESLDGYSFTWFNEDEEVIGDQATITVFEDGQYHVELSSENGCKNTYFTQVNINTDDFADLGEDISVSCDDVTLNAGFPGSSYLWSDGSSDQTLTVKESGEFWVEISHPEGCIDRDTIQVEILPPVDSAFFLSATESHISDTVFFIGLTKNQPRTIAWDFDDGTTSDELLYQEHLYASIGEFVPSLTTIFNDGCVDTYAKHITIIEEQVEGENTRTISRSELFKDVLIYPNPNDGNFKLDMELSMSADVKISFFNPGTFQMIDQKMIKNSDTLSLEYNYSGLNPGVYTLRIESNGEIKSYRIIVVR